MGTAQLPARANKIMISVLSYHRGMPDAIFVFVNLNIFAGLDTVLFLLCPSPFRLVLAEVSARQVVGKIYR